MHFRGRHLHGTRIPLPATHTGAILQVTDKSLARAAPVPDQQAHPDSEDEEDVMDDVKIAEQIGSFDEIVVWEHGGVVEGEREGCVRGVGEWVGWAGSMHVDEEDDSAGEKA